MKQEVAGDTPFFCENIPMHSRRGVEGITVSRETSSVEEAETSDGETVHCEGTEANPESLPRTQRRRKSS